MPTKRQNKNNKKDANSGNKIDNKINGITLDLVALLAFTLLTVSFFSANNMPFIMNAVSIMIFGAYFLGKAIVSRILAILKNSKSDKELKRYVPLAINLILLSLLLFIPVRFFNDYVVIPNRIDAQLNFERDKDNGSFFIIAGGSNATTFGSFSAHDDSSLDKALDDTKLDKNNLTNLLKNKSPLQRASSEGSLFHGLIFILDLAFLLVALAFISKLLLDIIGQNNHENKNGEVKIPILCLLLFRY